MTLAQTRVSEAGDLRWQHGSDAPPLGDSEVHIWIVPIDSPCPVSEHRLAILAPDERRRAEALRSERDRTQFLRRRLALRTILGGYLEVAPCAIEYCFNAFGKPALRPTHPDRTISFSTSHSSGITLVAVARCARIGIDLERLAAIAEADGIAARHFTPNEASALANLPERDRLRGFYTAWTRKEAVVKALGRGLSIALDTFEISLQPNEPPRILGCAFDPTLAQKLRLIHLAFCAGYVGALACEPASLRVRHGVFERAP